jgi:hypothetical protein
VQRETLSFELNLDSVYLLSFKLNLASVYSVSFGLNPNSVYSLSLELNIDSVYSDPLEMEMISQERKETGGFLYYFYYCSFASHDLVMQENESHILTQRDRDDGVSIFKREPMVLRAKL